MSEVIGPTEDHGFELLLFLNAALKKAYDRRSNISGSITGAIQSPLHANIIEDPRQHGEVITIKGHARSGSALCEHPNNVIWESKNAIAPSGVYVTVQIEIDPM